MTQDDIESFKAYAQRWRDFTAQVRPPLEEKELTEIFLNTLDQFYQEHMIESASSNFEDMLTVGMRIEEWVQKGHLVKESVHIDDSKDDGQEVSMVKGWPQQQYLVYHPVAAVIPDANLLYQPQFQQCQQPPRQQAPRTQIDPISMKYANLFPKLFKRNLVYTKAPPPMLTKLTSRYRPDLFCAFHQGASGHDIEHCFPFRKVF